MKQYLTITILIISINLAKADSPLTSIKFWDLSDDPYVLKIGNLPGKKTLDSKAFQYLINPANSKANKYALVNALGWEYRSKVKNSDNFLHFLNQKFEKEINEFRKQNKVHFIYMSRQKDLIKNFMKVSLECEYLKFYNYLLAMDDYLYVSQLKSLCSSWKNECFKGSDFDKIILVLLKSQIQLLQNSCIEFREMERIFIELEINRTYEGKAIGHRIFSYLQNYRKS